MVEYKLIFTAIAAIIFVLIFVSGYFFVQSEIKKININTEIFSQKLEAIDIPHVVERCFKTEDAILAEFLDNEEKLKKDICDICRICLIPIEIRITDLENNNEWKFGNVEKHYSHSIFVNIKYANEIHPGRLYAKI